MNFIEGCLSRGDSPAFESGALRFPLPQPIRERLISDTVGETVLGIRPEDIHEASALESDEVVELTVHVDAVEPIGSETYVYFQVGGTSFVVRVSGGFEGRVGDRLTLAFDLAALHLFDVGTGETFLEAL
jgi:multiple sugar transport system ATP-binding protein